MQNQGREVCGCRHPYFRAALLNWEPVGSTNWVSQPHTSNTGNTHSIWHLDRFWMDSHNWSCSVLNNHLLRDDIFAPCPVDNDLPGDFKVLFLDMVIFWWKVPGAFHIRKYNDWAPGFQSQFPGVGYQTMMTSWWTFPPGGFIQCCIAATKTWPILWVQWWSHDHTAVHRVNPATP